MSKVDKPRRRRLQEQMEQAGIEALICKLPENVVYLTNYWPHHGFSVAAFTRDGRCRLHLPEVEADYGDPDWAEITTFGWGLLKDGDLYQSYAHILDSIRDGLKVGRARIGVERSLEITGPTYRSAEPVVPAGPWHGLLEQAFPKAELVDAADLIAVARSRKTAFELEKLRIANEIAELGMREFLKQLKPGMSEVQVGALIEAKIRGDGPGHKGARLVRASAEVGAGPVGSTKGTLLVPSTTYEIQRGDIVMVELATVVDGYWSDLTYVSVAGDPNPRQREVYNQVLQAQQAGAAQMRAGASFADPDRAAREVLEAAGLGEYFVHITGHGVGYRYHEFIPFLFPGAEGTLEEGMVSSVEPGVYIPNFGGIRIEDNVAVGKRGPQFLSTPRQPW
ncbi:MAG TPA: Xaa-Pro peptidase family protein [Anaerolineales bacterium]